MAHFVFYNMPSEVAAVTARLRADLAANRMRLALVRLCLALKYSLDQPRVAAGSPDGGQWTAGGNGYAQVGDNNSGATRRTPPKRRGTTETDNRHFVDANRVSAQTLSGKLGRGSNAEEFLALSSVESTWGISDAATIANNYFGIHNSRDGPFPGQTGTYVTSGVQDVPGQLISHWIPPYPPSSPVQAVAAFPAESGFVDSGSVAVSRLQKAGGDYSNPATFFASVRAHGWAEGANAAVYVRAMLQRYRHVSRY